MADPLNYVGAAIFWLYILAALAFTAVALSTIVGLTRSQTSPYDHVAFRVQVFSILAFISFAVLSFNMLHVLIQSFRLWTLRNTPRPFTDLPSLLHTIYHWSTTSTLFYDFAVAIVATHARCLWVQSALFMTLFQCFELALQGTAHHIPNLWAFFALSQILPISFAQNLFYLALLRTPSFNEQGRERPLATLKQSDANSVIAVYWAALCVASATGQGTREILGCPLLIWVVLGTRALLLLPRFLVKTQAAAGGRGDGRGDDRVDRAWVGKSIYGVALCAFLLRLSWMLFESDEPLSDIVPALAEHPAVTALGMDFVVSLVSLGAWNWLQQDAALQERNK